MMTVFNTLKTVGKALAVLKLTEGVAEMAAQSESQPKEPQTDTGSRTIVEEIEVEGRQLVQRVRELIREGNVRTLRVKDKNGKYLLEIPLTVGVVAGGVFAITAPWTIALSALAGFVMDVTIEIIRDDEGGGQE